VHSAILAAREAQIIPGDVIAVLSAAMTTNRAQTDLRGTQEVPEETLTVPLADGVTEAMPVNHGAVSAVSSKAVRNHEEEHGANEDEKMLRADCPIISDDMRSGSHWLWEMGTDARLRERQARNRLGGGDWLTERFGGGKVKSIWWLTQRQVGKGLKSQVWLTGRFGGRKAGSSVWLTWRHESKRSRGQFWLTGSSGSRKVRFSVVTKVSKRSQGQDCLTERS
jgi:hypothetical protein